VKEASVTKKSSISPCRETVFRERRARSVAQGGLDRHLAAWHDSGIQRSGLEPGDRRIGDRTDLGVGDAAHAEW